MIFYIKDERQIDVEVIGPRDAAYDAFLEDLQKGGSGECRYGLFDFEYTHQCQGTSEVIISFLQMCRNHYQAKKSQEKIRYQFSKFQINSLGNEALYEKILFYFRLIFANEKTFLF